jgi:hypothetical protein
MKTLQLLKTFGFFALFIFFYGCTEENYYTTIEGLGKVNVYIEGDITNAEAQAKLEAQIGTQTENIYVRNTTQLTEIVINVGLADNIRDIIIKNNNALQTLNINGNNSKCNQIILETKNTQINLNGFIELNELNYSTYSTGENNQLICNDLIKIINNLEVQASGDGKVKFNHLKYITGGIFLITGEFVLFDIPVLEEVDTIILGIQNNVVTFPALKKVNHIQPYGVGGETYFETLNLPVLEEINSQIWIKTIQTNITLNIPSLVYCKSIIINEGTGLSSDKVNAILNKFLNVLPLTGKAINLQWQSPAAPPTGQGLIDKQTLINQGNTVLTD